LLDLGLVPVISAITHDGKGQLLNTNADTMAAEIAMALATSNEVELVFTFEKPGVLDGHGQVIPTIDPEMFKQLKEARVIVDGMIPKLTNAFAAIAAGVKSVKLVSSDYLLDASIPHTKVIQS
jgi:acetylglutamate kinase